MKMPVSFSPSKMLPGRTGILYMLCAVFLFIVVYWIIRPELLYLRYQPFFAFDPSFYDFHYQFRLGTLSLFSQFILQFMAFPIAGSLILVFLLLSVAAVTGSIFKKTRIAGYEGIEFIIPILLLAPLKFYSSGLETLIIVLISGLVSMGVSGLRQSIILTILYQVLSLILIDSLLGWTAAILLGFLFILVELINRNSFKWLISVSAVLVTSFIISLLTGGRLILTEISNYSFFDPAVHFPSLWSIIISFSLIGLLSFFPLRTYKGNRVFQKIFVFPVILLILISISFKFLFINPNQYQAVIDKLVEEKKWNEALGMKGKLGLQDRIARFQLNRGLFYTGQLSENLFSIPQNWGEYGLFLNKNYTPDCLPHSSDLFYELGFMKAAMYWMLEEHTTAPYSPAVLQRLAFTSLAQGKYNTAVKYLTILSKSPVYSKKYREYLRRLEQDPDKFRMEMAPANLAFIQGNEIINIREPDTDLINILKVSRQNKMAFEYLMAYYILRLDLDQFYKFIPLVKASGYYSRFPHTYEEVLLACYIKNNRPPSTWEYAISKNTIQRFVAFRKAKDEGGSGFAEKKEQLRPLYGDTFWYYMNFDSPDLPANNFKIIKP
jgi:hypothetical protein